MKFQLPERASQLLYQFSCAHMDTPNKIIPMEFVKDEVDRRRLGTRKIRQRSD